MASIATLYSTQLLAEFSGQRLGVQGYSGCCKGFLAHVSVIRWGLEKVPNNSPIRRILQSLPGLA
jgi:hypothetical protein